MKLNLTGFLPVSGIYEITNLVNGRIYVGQSRDVYKRIADHVSHLVQGDHHNSELRADVLRYGLRSFECELVLECDPSELLVMENRRMRKHISGNFVLYNLTQSSSEEEDDGVVFVPPTTDRGWDWESKRWHSRDNRR